MSKDNTLIERGQRIRSLREKLKLTRLQFHQKTGISASTLRALEVGEIKLTPSKALTLSHMFIFVLGLTPEEASQDVLLYGVQKKSRTVAKKTTGTE
ncbi:MAG: Helix-turn-helix domain [Alphaproteobacteria bacterium]|jgi:transcriptional regulator with XRE-family HTH domain|nr:Helix-turn-helix domain [Alphaproteobacteria bacterium]